MSFESPERSKIPKEPIIEIERKFLVAFIPEEIELDNIPSEHIVQGYLSNGSGRNSVRIRKKGDKYEWTVKQKYGLNPAARIELECEISKEQFDTMWPATEGRRLEKTRYEIPYGRDVIELDVYHGELAGRMLAEVEFDSELDAEFYEPPTWLGQDVTYDGRFRNSNIAKDGFPVDSLDTI